MNKEELKRIFTEYVFDNYDMSDIGISRKYYHSLRVMDIAEDIAINSGFDESDIELSIIVGLLHDYARFPQWKKYKTYSDLKSIDHGDLAVKLLFDNNEIEKFNINIEYYDEIYDAIKYHNKKYVATGMSKHNNKICKLIRDADKLDIFYIFGVEKEVFQEDNAILDKEVIIDFYANKQLDRKKIKSKNDNILLDIGLIFDLNYEYSYEYVKENKLLEKMYENIINKELFKEYFEYAKKHIEERID